MTTTDQPADGTRWQGYSHKELYLMLHDGPGAGASAEPSRRWAEIATTLNEVGQDLGKAIELTNEGWSGPAAGRAYDRLTTTVAWAEDAGATAGVMRTSVEDQGDHIAKARADMPKPEDVSAAQPDPTAVAAVQVVQAQTDAEPAEAATSSDEQRAVEVMAAYEENTKATTAALAPFDAPKPLVESTHLHHNRGGGLLGIVPTVIAGLLGGGWHDEQRHDHGRPDKRESWHAPNTSNSSARWEEVRRPAILPGPGKTMGVSTEPLLAPTPGTGNNRQQERSARNTGNGGGHTPNPGARTGGANMSVPNAELQQAAAASQAAAGTPTPGGAPLAPATGGMPGGQDKLALRRFGMEAIGSSQWFGDSEEPVVGESPKRRFDLRASVESTENVTILDDESHLPPTVIGDGGR